MTIPTAPIIGTHSGTFHCDEALACYMLRLLPRFAQSSIIRTRDRGALAHFAIIVDVGDVYDPAALRFDHHQKGFAETFSPRHPTKLSSAGLIYKHFGRDLLHQAVPDLAPADLELLYQKLYDSFIEEIDGIDNGVPAYRCTNSECTAGVTRSYHVDSDLSSRVGRLNPSWNEETDDADLDRRFVTAMELVGGELRARITSYATSWLPGRQVVHDAMAERMAHDPAGRIICMNRFCPWKEHLHTLEKDMGVTTPILYAIYPDTSNTWRVQAVPTQPGAFGDRLSLPAAWRGLRDGALSEVTGVSACTFVHSSGFIGGNQTKDGALQMARKAINLQE